MDNPTSTFADPFRVLDLPADAGEEDVRKRYLELVKQFPPDRNPERFREIRAAYEATKDSLAIASRLIRPPDPMTPEWADVIQSQKKIRPKLTPEFLLSLGNRNAKSPDPIPNHHE